MRLMALVAGIAVTTSALVGGGRGSEHGWIRHSRASTGGPPRTTGWSPWDLRIHGLVEAGGASGAASSYYRAITHRAASPLLCHS